MESFKKSFSLYVDSGMREMVEVDIDMLRNKEGKFLVTKNFKEKFCKFIVHHYLRKFHCLYLHSTHLSFFFAYI